MYFALEPKCRRKDLFDFEDELKRLEDGVKFGRIILITAPRRFGKTSLLKTFLNECSLPFILIDARRVIVSEGTVNMRGFMIEFANALNDFLNRYRGVIGKFIDSIKGLDGVEVTASFIRLSWKKKNRANIALILDNLNKWALENNLKVILAFDELQEFRVLPINFPSLLAYIYDNLLNIVVILTGSQVGLLYDLLKVDNPKSPLYGRVLYEVKLRRLSNEEAIAFLREGFRQLSYKVNGNLIVEAVSKLDGILGWLTFFGWGVAYGGETSLNRILEHAARQAIEELKSFLKKSRAENRYKIILRTIAVKPSTWSVIKKSLEAEEGIEIDDKNFTNLLNNLLKLNFIEKHNNLYAIGDPVLRHGILLYL